jgi:hypothetical protein
MRGVEFVNCPEPGCEMSAEVLERFVLPSTDGPVEHCKTSCVGGHVRTPLATQLTTAVAAPNVAPLRH